METEKIYNNQPQAFGLRRRRSIGAPEVKATEAKAKKVKAKEFKIGKKHKTIDIKVLEIDRGARDNNDAKRTTPERR